MPMDGRRAYVARAFLPGSQYEVQVGIFMVGVLVEAESLSHFYMTFPLPFPRVHRVSSQNVASEWFYKIVRVQNGRLKT